MITPGQDWDAGLVEFGMPEKSGSRTPAVAIKFFLLS